MARIQIKRDVHLDARLRRAVEQSFAPLPEEYSVSIGLREGSDDWSVEVIGPASVVAGRIPLSDQKPDAVTRYLQQMISGLRDPG
jgi:hypothetical protein